MRKDIVVGVFLLLVFALGVFVFYQNIDGDITGHALLTGDSSNVSRSFFGNLANENISVRISVNIDPNFEHKAYVVEDTVPAGFNIVDSGDASVSGNVLRWYEIDNVSGIDSVDLVYVVETSSVGTYSFSGSYGIDRMDIEESIVGPSLLVEEEDLLAPVFVSSFSSPPSYSFDTNSEVEVIWSDNVAVVGSYIESNFSGSLENISGSSWSGVLGAGSYQWRGYAWDAAGNVGVTLVYNFTIPKADSGAELRLNGVDGDIDIGLGASVNIDASADKAFVLYENGVDISGHDNPRIYSSSGRYNLTLVVLEDSNFSAGVVTRFVNVSETALEVEVIWNHSRWLNDTTNFSESDLSNIANTTFSHSRGKIKFLENLSILRNLNLSGIVVEDGRIFVDSVNLPEFNLSAELSFYGLTFVDPRILKDGVDCVSCAEKSYVNGILVVEVDSFSEYLVVEGYVDPFVDDGGSSGGGGGGGGGGSSEEIVVLNNGTGINITSLVDDSCISNYSCREWSNCVNGSRSRVCSDLNECNNEKHEAESCDVQEGGRFFKIWNAAKSSGVMFWVWILVVVLLLVLAGLILWVRLKFGRLGLRGFGR